MILRVTGRLRFNVLKRDNFTCQYCGAKAPEARIDVDHVIARSLGGKDELANLVAACYDCNTGKSDVPLSSPPVEVRFSASNSKLITIRLHSHTMRRLKREARAVELKPSRLIRQLVEKAYPSEKAKS